MKIIVCVADNNGILFNKRRVSKDIELINDIVKNTPELILSDYSKPLFDGMLITSSPDGYRFLEEAFDESFDNVSEIIIYRWNRDYPADTFFEFDRSEYELADSYEFAGKSHDRITRELWKRK